MIIFYTIERGNKDGFVAAQIYAEKLLSPTQVDGKPIQIIIHHPWQEGLFILHRNDNYFLTYSCGGWTDSTYHVRYAIGNSPMWPFAEQPDMILKTNILVKGLDHHSLFVEQAGKDWVVNHGWDTAHKVRYPRINLIFQEGGKLSSDGPTYTPQSISK